MAIFEFITQAAIRKFIDEAWKWGKAKFATWRKKSAKSETSTPANKPSEAAKKTEREILNLETRLEIIENKMNSGEWLGEPWHECAPLIKRARTLLSEGTKVEALSISLAEEITEDLEIRFRINPPAYLVKK